MQSLSIILFFSSIVMFVLSSRWIRFHGATELHSSGLKGKEQDKQYSEREREIDDYVVSRR